MDSKTKYCHAISYLEIDVQIQCSPNQNPNRLLKIDIDKHILKFYGKARELKYTKTILKKRTN